MAFGARHAIARHDKPRTGGAAPEEIPDVLHALDVDAAPVKSVVIVEKRYYVSSLQPDSKQLAHAIRSHWAIGGAVVQTVKAGQ